MTVTRRSKTDRSTEWSLRRSDSKHIRRDTRHEKLPQAAEIKTLTTHYIDGSFVESHGREVMDIIKPTNGKVIARVTMADEEHTLRSNRPDFMAAWISSIEVSST